MPDYRFPFLFLLRVSSLPRRPSGRVQARERIACLVYFGRSLRRTRGYNRATRNRTRAIVFSAIGRSRDINHSATRCRPALLSRMTNAVRLSRMARGVKRRISRAIAENVRDVKGRGVFLPRLSYAHRRADGHCVLRIYARDVATARGEFEPTFWTGATSVYSRDCESFIKHSRFCRVPRRKYPSSPAGPSVFAARTRGDFTRARARARFR